MVWAVPVALCVGAGPARAQARTDPPVHPASPSCTVTEVSRSPLVIDANREMFIEPMVVLPSRGEIFLAGSPNYLYAPGTAGEARDFVRDSVFGAVIGADRRGRLVTVPPRIDPSRVASIHGAVLPDGRWAVVFAEVKHPWVGGVPDTIVTFWHGVYDGRAWSRLERMPLPTGGAFLKAGASDLIVRGDTLFFAARLETSAGDWNVALFERRRGRWMLDVLPTRGASYVQLTYADSGLLIAVVRPDYSLPADISSLFIHARTEPWSSAHRVARGWTERIYEPAFTTSSRGRMLTWWVAMPSGTRRARAIVGPLRSDTRVLTLDTSTSLVRAVPGRTGLPVWVSEHHANGIEPELRYHTIVADTVTVAGRTATPFTGPFATASTAPDSVLIAGPLLRSESANPSLVTLLIRLRVACAPGAPPPDGWTLARRVYVHPSTGGLDDSSSANPRALRQRDDPVRLRH